jgi:2-oxoglutarate dehydrogenase E2 component (dihydrolipoamide succinyltransferase)
MATEIRVPALGESVSEATIGQWFKKPGDAVTADEPVVELETDKVTIEVRAPGAGVLEAVTAKPGDTVKVGAVLGQIGSAAAAPATASPPPKPRPAAGKPAGKPETVPLSPAVRKIVEERHLEPHRLAGSGKNGRLTKGDVLGEAPRQSPQPTAPAPPTATAPAAPPPVPEAPKPSTAPIPAAPQTRAAIPGTEAREERVRMSRLRQTIARRLKDAQNTAAMLTTFNEVDMHQVMEIRGHYKESFEKKHGVRLGFMGFFVKAVIQALKEVPEVNAEVDGEDLVYKNYYNIGVAVGTDKGLVVPVVSDADHLSLAAIERAISELGRKAREGTLTIEEMQGGTFTITNGGVYGSLMSTPILNAPQSGILGMHKIEQRPVVDGDRIVIRPMMYLALSYDHRIVDGREAVTFLVRVKESLEDPQRLLLEL